MISFEEYIQDAYNKLRFNFICNLEENGTPKDSAYSDSKGIPTIGVGFKEKGTDLFFSSLRK